jgi:hypothetical protein
MFNDIVLPLVLILLNGLFERRRHRVEIVDMDGNRVDRVLVSRAIGAGQ